MYLNYFNLREKPFNISPDSRFLWLSEKHKEGLAALKYAILEEKGFLCLTGDVGTGKTLLIRAYTNMSDIETLIATIPDPDLEIMDFFRLLAEEFNMKGTFESKGDFLVQLKHFLLESYGSDKKVLLIIDEAQRLNHKLLEQIRLLSNIEMDHRKLINIFFVGQVEFSDMLMEERNRAVRQRIAVSYRLEPLTGSETADYIRHRLNMAGNTDDIFKPGAVSEIYNLSKGYPRLINIICDFALMTAYSTEKKKIDAGMIKDCSKELHISIGFDKAQKKQFKDRKEVSPFTAAPTAEKPRSKLRYGLAFVMLALLSFGGYQIYKSITDNPPRWEMEEFAPKKENWLLDEQSEKFKSEIENQKKALSEQTNSNPVPGENKDPDATDYAEINDNLVAYAEQPVAESEQNTGSDNDDSQPVDNAIDEKSIIFFEHNSNELPEKAYETLNNIVKLTSQRPDVKITVEGFTDSYGDNVYNRQLSQYRADMVKNYLIGNGIAPSKISASGRGKENPIESNATFEGRKQNRRVEIRVNSE
jgi:general secretion pathway protein A